MACYGAGWDESFQTKQHQLVDMANVDINLQLLTMVGYKVFYITVRIDLKEEDAILHRHQHIHTSISEGAPRIVAWGCCA